MIITTRWLLWFVPFTLIMHPSSPLSCFCNVKMLCFRCGGYGQAVWGECAHHAAHHRGSDSAAGLRHPSTVWKATLPPGCHFHRWHISGYQAQRWVCLPVLIPLYDYHISNSNFYCCILWFTCTKKLMINFEITYLQIFAVSLHSSIAAE